MGLFGGSKSSSASTTTTITQVEDARAAGSDQSAVATKDSRAVSGEGVLLGPGASIVMEAPEALAFASEALRSNAALAERVATQAVASQLAASQSGTALSSQVVESIRQREAPETTGATSTVTTALYVVGAVVAFTVLGMLWRSAR